MYIANFDDELCGAKYYYKNRSIYFNANYSLSDADTFALHECIHYLQEQKDDKGNLVRFGLYDFAIGHGMAINEAAVQLMTVNALNTPTGHVTYYGLDIPSNSIDCYPLECVILNQMAYFTGTYPLYYSTIEGNDVFKNTFIAVSSKKAYNIVESSLDKMLQLENSLSVYSQDLKNSVDNIKAVRQLNTMIEKNKEQIRLLFFKCQNTIIAHCFSYYLNNVHSIDDIASLKKKIYDFKDIIGTNSTYEFYNEFYRRLMEALDEKYEKIKELKPFETTSSYTALEVYNKSKSVISIFKRLFTKLGLARQKEM